MAGDFGIQAVGADATALIGLAAIHNAAGLPGITSITIRHTTSNQFYTFETCNDLLSLSWPDLVSLTGSTADAFSVVNCPALADVSMPNYSPANGKNVIFQGCNLTAASVNHILARCIANAGYVTGQVLLDGGTNSPPTGQGAIDANDLANRGVQVQVN